MIVQRRFKNWLILLSILIETNFLNIINQVASGIWIKWWKNGRPWTHPLISFPNWCFILYIMSWISSFDKYMGNCLERRTASPCENKAIHFTMIHPEAENMLFLAREKTESWLYSFYYSFTHIWSTNYVLVIVVRSIHSEE